MKNRWTIFGPPVLKGLRSVGFYDENRHLKNAPMDFKLPNLPNLLKNLSGNGPRLKNS
jgi:hypothetical protein